jgi:hypothetical protein
MTFSSLLADQSKLTLFDPKGALTIVYEAPQNYQQYNQATKQIASPPSLNAQFHQYNPIASLKFHLCLCGVMTQIKAGCDYSRIKIGGCGLFRCQNAPAGQARIGRCGVLLQAGSHEDDRKPSMTYSRSDPSCEHRL